MKEIITKIYSSGNFPIVLFSTIGVLLVLFIITLLLAVSDTKKRQNKEKKESSSLDNTDLYFTQSDSKNVYAYMNYHKLNDLLSNYSVISWSCKGTLTYNYEKRDVYDSKTNSYDWRTVYTNREINVNTQGSTVSSALGVVQLQNFYGDQYDIRMKTLSVSGTLSVMCSPK